MTYRYDRAAYGELAQAEANFPAVVCRLKPELNHWIKITHKYLTN